MEKEGVTVGYKEIYDELRSVSQSLIKLDHRMERIEERFHAVETIDERSREALDVAEEAKRDVEKLEGRFVKYMESEEEKIDREKKYKLTAAGIFITVLLFVLPMIIQYYN